MSDRDLFTRYFREVQPKFARLCVRILSKGDLTMPQFALLNILASSDEIPMTELSDKLHITKPAVTNLVDRLEKKKYIQRIAHEDDRRVHRIKIESKGEKIVRCMQSSILQYLLKALEEFQPKERQTIIRFYEQLSKTLDEFLVESKSK